MGGGLVQVECSVDGIWIACCMNVLLFVFCDLGSRSLKKTFLRCVIWSEIGSTCGIYYQRLIDGIGRLAVIAHLRVHVILVNLPSSFASACLETFSLDCDFAGLAVSSQ